MSEKWEKRADRVWLDGYHLETITESDLKKKKEEKKDTSMKVKLILKIN